MTEHHCFLHELFDSVGQLEQTRNTTQRDAMYNCILYMKGLISILQSSSAAEEDYWFEMRPDVREGWGGVLGLGFLRSETGIGRVLERSYVTAYQNL